MCLLLQFSYSPSFSGGRRHIQKISESKGLSRVSSQNCHCSCHTQEAEKEERWASGISLAGKTWASTRTPQSNEQPFKAQKPTEFIFFSLKIQKQDVIEFPITAKGSHAASVTSDAVFQAGGHYRRAQLHQVEFKALLSNVIHSLFPGGKKKAKKKY